MRIVRWPFVRSVCVMRYTARRVSLSPIVRVAQVGDNRLYSECLVGSVCAGYVRQSLTGVSCRGGAEALVDQVVIDGKPDQFRSRSPFELFQNADSIGADGLDTEGELFGDLGGGVASSDQAEDFKLPI